MDQRGISFEKFDEATADLTILEEYEGDQPYPICLALEFCRNGKPAQIAMVLVDNV